MRKRDTGRGGGGATCWPADLGIVAGPVFAAPQHPGQDLGRKALLAGILGLLDQVLELTIPGVSEAAARAKTMS